jgi:hypothetical protein
VVRVVAQLLAQFDRSVEAAARDAPRHPLRGSPVMIGGAALVGAYSVWELVGANGWQLLGIGVTLACVVLVVVFQTAVRRRIRRNAERP